MNICALPGGEVASCGRQALAHNGLASHSQEWNREWQRAQSRAWLHATPTADLAGSGAAAPMRAVETFSMMTGLSTSAPLGFPEDGLPHPVLRASGHPGFREAVRPWSLPSHETSVAGSNWQRGSGSVDAHVSPCGWQPTGRHAPAAGESVGRSAGNPVTPEPVNRQSLRLHVESTAEGLRVWIGVDGDEAAVCARAAAILAELRRSVHLPSFRLASFVCNGQVLHAWDPGFTTHSENPP